MRGFACLLDGSIRRGAKSSMSICLWCCMARDPPETRLRAYAVGEPETEVPFEVILDRLIESLAIRNPDFYESVGGELIAVRS